VKVLGYNSTYVGSGHNAGAETSLHDLLRLLKREGHKVEVLASRVFVDGSASYLVDGIPVNAYSSKRDPTLHFPGHDLIITQLECAARGSLVAQQHKIPTVQMVHNYTEFSLNIAERYCDKLVYNSYNTRAAVEANGTHKPNCVLYPLVDPALYKITPPRVDKGYITLVNLSDGTEPFYDKGHDVFYHLAARFPDLQFLGVLGAYGNQDVREMDNVTILPHTQNPLEIYRQTSVLLVPSTVESFGRVAVEAAASGIPSISTDLPGPLEAGVSFAYIDPKDMWTWESALTTLLNNYDWHTTNAIDASDRLWKQTQDQIPDFLHLIESG